MTVGIHQPHYFPWLGLLHKIACSDVFVLLDNVQFNRRSYQHRALYASKVGAQYLSLPVHAPNHQLDGIKIQEIQYAEPRAKIFKKHFQTLRHRYTSTPGWGLIQADLSALFEMHLENESVCDLIVASMKLTMQVLGIETPLVRASSLMVEGDKALLMPDLTRAVGGDTYLSGQGARVYNRPELFDAYGIQLCYQAFEHPVYTQTHGGAFVEGSMGLDFFFEHPDETITYFNKFTRVSVGAG